jgi:multidrug efflux pump subunit AcrA (membrane-fusion protein)
VTLSLAVAAGVACSQTGAQDTTPGTTAPVRGAAKTGSALPSLNPTSATPSIPAPSLRSGSAPPSKEVTTPGGNTGIKVPHGLVTLIGDVKVPAGETGILIKINVKEGDVVDIDTILAVIDDRDTRAKKAMAQGELEVAQAQAESTAEVEAAQKAIEVARAEYDQLVSIRRKNPGAVSDQETRRAHFQVERAIAQEKVAQTDRQVAALTVGVKKAQLLATDNELDRREIKSPLKGEVVEIYKKQGEWAQPGEPIMRIVSLDKLYVEGFVNADQASAGALEGKNANVTVHVFDPKSQKMVEHNVKGHINYASSLVEGSGRSRQFRVRAEIENTFADNNWVVTPGSMAEMTIDLSSSAPIRATGSAAPRGSSTPVSTRASTEEREPAAEGDDRSRTSPRFPRLSSPDGARDSNYESLKPVAPRASEENERDSDENNSKDDAPKTNAKKGTRPF